MHFALRVVTMHFAFSSSLSIFSFCRQCQWKKHLMKEEVSRVYLLPTLHPKGELGKVFCV
jgi:hypothetical protein